jgi:hypothetical protein
MARVRIFGFGEPTEYDSIEQAEADIRTIGPDWENVSLVSDSDGAIFDTSQGREHVGDEIPNETE